MRIQIRNWFTWDNLEKMLVIKAEPIPRDGSAEGTARIGAFIESKTLVSH